MPEVDYTSLRLSLQPGMRRWIESAIQPGGFLRSVLENDLTGACERADSFNGPYLPELVRWLNREAPALCWGSVSRVKAWPEILKEQRNHEGLAP